MIFDVNMGEEFHHKSRFVAKSHKNETPILITYIMLVYLDYVRICLTIEALNDLDVLAADAENTYISAPCCE